MDTNVTQINPRISLIVLEESQLVHSYLCGYPWELQSIYFSEENEIKDILPRLLEFNPVLPQNILYGTKAMLNADQNKIAILAKLINITKQHSTGKIKLLLTAQRRVKLIGIKKLKEYSYTASYTDYKDFTITDKSKLKGVLNEIE